MSIVLDLFRRWYSIEGRCHIWTELGKHAQTKSRCGQECPHCSPRSAKIRPGIFCPCPSKRWKSESEPNQPKTTISVDIQPWRRMSCRVKHAARCCLDPCLFVPLMFFSMHFREMSVHVVRFLGFMARQAKHTYCRLPCIPTFQFPQSIISKPRHFLWIPHILIKKNATSTECWGSFICTSMQATLSQQFWCHLAKLVSQRCVRISLSIHSMGNNEYAKTFFWKHRCRQ